MRRDRCCGVLATDLAFGDDGARCRRVRDRSTNHDAPGREVEVLPLQCKHLASARTGVGSNSQEQIETRWGCGQDPLHLGHSARNDLV